MVNSRALPEYYQVIKEPIALSVVKVRARVAWGKRNERLKLTRDRFYL
jgi:hypothetical protein